MCIQYSQTTYVDKEYCPDPYVAVTRVYRNPECILVVTDNGHPSRQT